MNSFLCRVIIIGEPCTGKTSLLWRYSENVFIDNYKCTIGIDFKVKQIKLKEGILKMQLWDTAGQERFKVLTKSYFRGSRCCLVLYDVTRRTTFEKVTEWVNQFKEEKSTQENILVIVGNKNDLVDQRKVTYEEGENLAKMLNCFFFEISVKENPDSVNKLFETVAEQVFPILIKEFSQNESQKDENKSPNLNPGSNNGKEDPNKCSC